MTAAAQRLMSFARRAVVRAVLLVRWAVARMRRDTLHARLFPGGLVVISGAPTATAVFRSVRVACALRDEVSSYAGGVA